MLLDEKLILVDSHCHLDYPELSMNLDSLMSRAFKNNVKVMLAIATKIQNSKNILSIAEKFNNIYCSIGSHPHHAALENSISSSEIIKLSQHEKVVAIGETGLDFYYQNSPKEQQINNFRIHINASKETGLPLVIHSRNADEAILQILKEENKKGKFPCLLHCFTGSQHLAEEALSLGIFISFSGIITFKNAQKIREIAKEVPNDRILIETDSPYLSPEPFRGKINEPANVFYVAECLAKIKKITLEEISFLTTNNFFKLFKKIKKLK